MEDVLKQIEEAIKNGAKVEIHKIELPQEDEGDWVSDAVEIAHLNKVMFDAHTGQGFSPEEALKLTIAVMNTNN